MLSYKERSGLLLALTTAFISGLSIFINKIGVEEVDPLVFTGSKNLLVALFLLVIILGSRKSRSLKNLKIKDWLVLFLIGLLGGSLPFLLFFKGLLLTSAAQASFIHKGMFLFAAPLALVFLKEHIKKNFLIAALFLLGGNYLFFRLNSFHLNQGDLLIFLSTILWAIEGVFSKRALKRLSSQTVAFGRMFFGSFLLMFFLVVTGQISLIAQLTVSQLSWIVLTSFFLLGYVATWYAGLKLTRLSLAASVLTLGAPITAFLSAVFLNGGYSSRQIIGTLFLILGIMTLFGFRKKLSHVRG